MRRKQARPSFLKKRSKKLLFNWVGGCLTGAGNRQVLGSGSATRTCQLAKVFFPLPESLA
jgi:hypothetical protein